MILEPAIMLGGVALGSAVGGTTRFMVTGWVARAVGETFRWGTMAVNATGALVIGALAALADLGRLEAWAPVGWPHAWPVAVVGFLGNYTTVSSFSLQTLAVDHSPAKATGCAPGGNVALSLALCSGAVALGCATAVAVVGGPS